jgi:hypothetical protein
VSEAVIRAALEDAFAAGATTRGAAYDVSALLGVPRNRVYKLAVRR